MSRILFFTLLISLFLVRFSTAGKHFADGEKLRITAKVLEEPVRYSYKQSLQISGYRVYLPLFPEVSYGDKVIVEGEVDGEELINPKLIKIIQNENRLFGYRDKIVDFYKAALPEPHASLIAGIVLGSKSQIPSGFWQKLKEVGVTHVVVASGMNVTFVASFLISILTAFVARKRALIIALIGVWFYVLLAGFESPVVRAGIMATALFMAQISGKVAYPWRVLVLTCLVMLVIKPGWISDTGFLLTFTATASLMLFQKKVAELFKFIPKSLGFIKEGLVTSLAAQIGVAPILFVTFGGFNLISPLINAVILWTVPGIMVIAGVGGVVGTFFPLLGRLILYLSYPLTWWFIAVVNIWGSGNTYSGY